MILRNQATFHVSFWSSKFCRQEWQVCFWYATWLFHKEDEDYSKNIRSKHATNFKNAWKKVMRRDARCFFGPTDFETATSKKLKLKTAGLIILSLADYKVDLGLKLMIPLWRMRVIRQLFRNLIQILELAPVYFFLLFSCFKNVLYPWIVF